MVDFLADYYQNIEKYPVRSQVEPSYLSKCLPGSASYDPDPIEKILYDVESHIIPSVTHWQSPNHFAFFPSSGSIAGFLGEMLSTGFNVVGFNWMSLPAATELESIVMDWLGKMLQLPNTSLFSGGGGGGVLRGTTCEAILCTLAAARDQSLDRIGRDWIRKLVVYGSNQTHFTVQKVARIAGINPDNFRGITTTKAAAFGLSPDSLESRIVFDVKAGLIPFYEATTVGKKTFGASFYTQESPKSESGWGNMQKEKLQEEVADRPPEQPTGHQSLPTGHHYWPMTTISGRSSLSMFLRWVYSIGLGPKGHLKFVERRSYGQNKP
ncbi:hypothetical protein HYC85_006090 [Camellia sinensis]|uniref:Tyrosine decarboxylase n=1 Tax=Camellia sinensis TaxID=4442 RepID=A0A7J7I280_CAMSI|nr:hypothetical protein HYC85_006090 [Camellia sinensis]